MTRSSKRLGFFSAIGAAALLSGAPARAEEAPEARPVPKHHSKLKGAAVGGVGGAIVGGKKGAAAGAAGGALWQHHKNKKALKEQNKEQNR